MGLPLAEAFAKEFKLSDLILIPRKFIFTLTISKHQSNFLVASKLTAK